MFYKHWEDFYSHTRPLLIRFPSDHQETVEFAPRTISTNMIMKVSQQEPRRGHVLILLTTLTSMFIGGLEQQQVK